MFVAPCVRGRNIGNQFPLALRREGTQPRRATARTMTTTMRTEVAHEDDADDDDDVDNDDYSSSTCFCQDILDCSPA